MDNAKGKSRTAEDSPEGEGAEAEDAEWAGCDPESDDDGLRDPGVKSNWHLLETRGTHALWTFSATFMAYTTLQIVAQFPPTRH